MEKTPPNEPTYKAFEYVLIGIGILTILLALWSFLALYGQTYGHRPF